MDGEAADEPQSFREKALFYTTAFFVLLGTFSLFAFLFLVPFVIDPAFTTIFMQFEPRAAQCVTSETIIKRGTKNCTWASCREGCTREVYNCTQIRVDYRITPLRRLPQAAPDDDAEVTSPLPEEPPSAELNEWSARVAKKIASRPGADYESGPIEWTADWIDRTSPHKLNKRDVTIVPLMNDTSEWFFTGAKLFPNVKGCGYPPMLNCTIFLWKYQAVGTNFTCYYSRVDPMLVMSDLDMKQVYLNLVLATAIPIPSFIISVIYLAFAYFVIYAEEESVDPESVLPVEGEEGAVEGEEKENLNDGEVELEDKAPLEDSGGGGDENIGGDEKEPSGNGKPAQQPTPVESTPASGDLIKPPAMMVVRPTTLQPSGPIAAV
ncbi:protein tipE-like isoform X2 [Neocloeon triangulifer]|uniref:protein tipE-like isoform X2 n=1 Tax=Neocloeon triangulifer TaxID=2078957 RepID=UPI00286F84A7|nr:protein tipE-like isoform X2 [Neocloeon triangulifer]